MSDKKKNDNLSGIKNLIWAFGIFLCLIAVLVGFIYAAVGDYDGDGVIPTVNLGASEKSGKSSANAEPETSVRPVAGQLNELKKNKGGSDYVTSLYFLCDSVYSQMYLYGADPAKVWLGETGVLDAGSLSSSKIVFPGDGSLVTASNAAMITLPDVLVFLVGADGLAAVEGGNFREDYGNLIKSVQLSSPDTQIICCSICSFSPSYIPSDSLTSSTINDANMRLLDICGEYPVWYADTASLLCEEGYLKSEYASPDGRTLNGSGIAVILDYLQSHAIN